MNTFKVAGRFDSREYSTQYSTVDQRMILH